MPNLITPEEDERIAAYLRRFRITRPEYFAWTTLISRLALVYGQIYGPKDTSPITIWQAGTDPAPPKRPWVQCIAKPNPPVNQDPVTGDYTFNAAIVAFTLSFNRDGSVDVKIGGSTPALATFQINPGMWKGSGARGRFVPHDADIQGFTNAIMARFRATFGDPHVD